MYFIRHEKQSFISRDSVFKWYRWNNAYTFYFIGLKTFYFILKLMKRKQNLVYDMYKFELIIIILKQVVKLFSFQVASNIFADNHLLPHIWDN